MHIGFDAKRFFHNPTGLGNYSRSTLAGLMHYFPAHQYYLYSAQIPQSFLASQQGHNPVLCQPGPLGQLAPALWRSLGIPKTAQKDNLHIFHGLSHELPLTSFGASTRTVVTMHDLLFLTHPQLYPWLDRHIYRTKYKSSCLRAHCVIAISHKTAEDLCELFAISLDRVRVVYQSYTPHFAIPIHPAARILLRQKYHLPQEYIFYVGSLIERKGVHFLIQALAKIPSTHRPALVLAGTGPLQKQLQQDAATLGLSSSILFLGRVPDEDLPGLYQMAQVFVYPSLAEGFGIPIVEALASQTPVITSTGSCFSEPGGDAALYLPPGDISALAHTVEQVLGDNELRHTMITRGLKHVQKFHWQQTSRRLMDVYTELCP